MKQIIAIITIIVLSGVICALAFMPVKKGLTKYYANNFGHLTEILESKTAYDMIFIGSSRTIYQIYPKIIDSICSMNTFNAAITGARISDFDMILRGYLVNHPAPKVLVLNIDLLSFARKGEIRQYPEYYSFLNNEEVCHVLANYGYHPYLVKIFPFLAIMDLDDYNKENALRLLRGKGELATPKAIASDKGFVSIDAMSPYVQGPERYPVYQESIATLNGLIKNCKKNRIKLIFIYSPEYNFQYQRVIINADSILAMITGIANINHIPYLRDDRLDLCKNRDLFWNESHLNKKGGIIYSAILAKEINALLADHPDTLNGSY